MSLKPNEERALFELRDELKKKYKILDYKIYGSKARGHDQPGSDVDLMVELEEVDPTVEIDVANLVFDANLRNNCFISAVLFSRKELEEGPMDESPLYKAIQRDGIAI